MWFASLSTTRYRNCPLVRGHFFLAATAVVVAATVITAAAVVGHIAAIVAAAAEQDQQDDDPPAAVPTKTVVTHKTYLLERLAAFPLIPRYSASRKM